MKNHGAENHPVIWRKLRKFVSNDLVPVVTLAFLAYDRGKGYDALAAHTREHVNFDAAAVPLCKVERAYVQLLWLTGRANIAYIFLSAGYLIREVHEISFRRNLIRPSIAAEIYFVKGIVLNLRRLPTVRA